ncbi:CLUMA_CG019054, isoform A [Clunio marinus]|uniref:CLUMA_CG019054, isoform A n=1 Tax=Clunio marinus TaxID=568069 RepID=A0A1J1J422_9DIPT|nr:CLUMA_CG019054, isoform A [Clunio marinus]
MISRTNIEFEQLRYGVKQEVFGKSEKLILNNINGEFRSFELSAVLGASGSGKTSLLKILSGFMKKNVSGSIKINGDDRSDFIKKNSTFIMQEEHLHGLLTVHEAMNFAFKLKTGNMLSNQERDEKIVSILKTLGLSENLNNYSGDLSGGEQKRLSIALELVDDPSILFLDEPTTGLDSSSSTQCIKLLKKLALEGKIIICTIHTPSALLFEMFDHIYALADGCCIYQGSSKNLVPFLKELDLICPPTFNPSDFLLEIATNSYGYQNQRLVDKIMNGSVESYRDILINNNNNNNDKYNNNDAVNEKGHKSLNDIRRYHHYSPSFVTQLTQLLLRNGMFLMRDKMFLWIRVMVHLIVGLMIGFIYYNIGHEATEILNIFRFVPIAVGFLSYAGFYSLMVRFPLDLPITKRECFNRWYSSGSYYLALIISDIPIIITCCTFYTIIIFYFTDQPMESFRLINVIFIGILTSFTAQSYGLLIGSLFDVKIALVVAGFLMAFHVLFGGFFILMKDVSSGFYWLFETTYIKHSLDGFASLILGFNRKKLHCSDIYCHFEDPNKFMKFIGLEENLTKIKKLNIKCMNEKLTIEFEELRYSVKTVFYDIFGLNKKEILKGINGEFRGCELSAIMGPSGCGKSTLLNVLSGYSTSNVRGSIRVNGKPRDFNLFRKQSSYIMQEQNLHALLTLRETMLFSIRLKTGNSLKKEQREKKVLMILENLGLDNEIDTFVKDLSGGQQKRLAIALELVDDPSILFIDEPTTGLDSSSSTQCVKLLQKLAHEGKTIICTIHTPSALLLQMFDNLYTLADGVCIYQGASKNIVPFLHELDIICPETFNPADFLLEIANNDYGEQNYLLQAKIKNGLNNEYRKKSESIIIESNCELSSYQRSASSSSSFIDQVIQLTARNTLFNIRDKSYMLMRLVVYLFVGFLVGIMYYNIGNDAKQMINIYKSIFILVAFLMYTSLYSLAVRFPLDLPIIQREHFNRWYSTAAHYIALNLADVPIVIICSIMFTVVAYTMTNHPLEDFRLGTVLAIGLALSFTSQAYGIFAGSFVEIKLSLLFAALLMLYQIIFAGGLVFMKDVNPYWHWMFEISFMKHALDGYGSLILGFNRTKLECEELYCHFISTKKFMTMIDMREDIPKVFHSLGIIWAVFHFAAYCVMRFRLNH